MLTVLTRVPQLGLICLLLAVGSVVLGTLVHLVTLPVEFDASFRKALPMLTPGITCTTRISRMRAAC